MPRLYSRVDSRQACTRRIFWPISQSRRWRHPSGEFAKLFARTLLQLDMLASSVFLETSIPNIPSITILSFHFCLFSKSSASNNLVRRIYAHARPRIPSSLNSGAWKTGPNLPHGLIRQRDARGSPFSLLLSKYLLSSPQRTRDVPSA